jgi:hypothetical protein
MESSSLRRTIAKDSVRNKNKQSMRRRECHKVLALPADIVNLIVDYSALLLKERVQIALEPSRRGHEILRVGPIVCSWST